MTCTEIQNSLFSVKKEELDPAVIALLEKHLAGCEACRAVFDKVLKADRVLTLMKTAVPRIRDEQALTDSILMSIIKGSKRENNPVAQVFDRLMSVFSRPAIRFACSLVIILCGAMYLLMEYQDMKSIVHLEQRLGNEVNLHQAGMIMPGNDILRLFYDYYKLTQGTISYVEISNKLILMKKKDLLTLMNNYQKLDKLTRAQLDELNDTYLRGKKSEWKFSVQHDELSALRKEIDRVTKEIEILNHKERQ
jgi:hypothetical protein